MLQLRKQHGLLIKEAKNADFQQISENLAPCLFSTHTIGNGLKLAIEHWPILSLELCSALVRMVWRPTFLKGEIMTEEHQKDNAECKSETHGRHLCYIVSQGFNLSDPKEYDAIIKNPGFKCQHCGQSAKSMDNLCVPDKL
jgi:hypothetical protein